MAGKHQATLLEKKGGPLTVGERKTPEPGPHEILIEVKAIAINPVDQWQRDLDMPPVPSYPAVLGSDVVGVVAKVGSSVSGAPAQGSRVLALASAFYENGSADHGGFQKLALARAEAVTSLPDALSFEQGAVFPLAVLTALSGWTTVGIDLDTKYKPQDKEAILIWGGASSVGTLTIQSAKSMGFVVYATASPKHNDYLKKLGADAVFDYKASNVVTQIIDTVKKDGVKLRTANCVVNESLQPTLDVLKATKGDATAKVIHTAFLQPGHPTLDGAEIKFNLPPMDRDERAKHYHKVFDGWLANGLKAGTIVPSPPIKTISGGLEGVNKGMDVLKEGVSLTKIVVPF